MRRRDFIKATVGAAAAWPSAVRAQRSVAPVIGFLGPGSARSDAYRVTAFRQGLREAGFVDGQNCTIEYRWAEGHYDRLGTSVLACVSGRAVACAVFGASVERDAGRSQLSRHLGPTCPPRAAREIGLSGGFSVRSGHCWPPSRRVAPTMPRPAAMG